MPLTYTTWRLRSNGCRGPTAAGGPGFERARWLGSKGWPVILDLEPAGFERVPGADLYDTVGYRKRVVLTDGGVYDNLGLETVWKRYETVLTSDAGAPFGLFPDPGTSWYRQTFRSFDIATNQARGLRKRLLIDLYEAGVRRGAYWGIMTEIGGYQLPDALPVAAETTAKLARMRTRLNPFNEAEQASLINWGYAVSDAALRRFVLAMQTTPGQWPYPEYALDRPLSSEVKVEPIPDPVDVQSAPARER